LSREHVLSRGLFVDKAVTVSDWGGNGPRTVGVSSLVAMVLCAKHNSQLSKTDAEIARLANALRTVSNTGHSQSLALNGWAIEQWFIKTMVNLCASGWMGSRGLILSDEIARAAFGHARLQNGAGLYCIDAIESKLRPADTVEYGILHDSTNRATVCGLYVQLRGLPMLLSIKTGDPSELIRRLGPTYGVDLHSVTWGWIRSRHLGDGRAMQGKPEAG
jgi:hypothetical protein